MPTVLPGAWLLTHPFRLPTRWRDVSARTAPRQSGVTVR
jgi:hypothetical protein